MEALRPVVSVFGATQPGRTHWLFAILSTDREAAVRRGRRLGLDVAAGASSIAAVPRPAERPDLPALRSEAFMQRILFVPVQPEIPSAALRGVERVILSAPLRARLTPLIPSDSGASTHSSRESPSVAYRDQQRRHLPPAQQMQ